MNILKLKKTIVKFIYAIMLLLLFVGNVDVHAGTVLKERNTKKETVSKKTKVVNVEDDEVVDGETSSGKTIGHPLTNAEHHDTWNGKGGGADSVGGVIVAKGDGGGSGSGGGAKKNSGSTAGGNTTLADSGKSTKKNISTTVEENNRDAAINETMGFAKDEGEYHAEREGSHAGKKVFEIDRNGNLGMNDKLGILDARGLFGFALFLAFGVGAAAFLLASRDVRKKSNYF